MPVRPTSHFTWQVLRTVKRSKKPLDGRSLRLVPSRKTKDGAFLVELVEEGLLEIVSGTTNDPFSATFALTEMGKHAAEFGEYEYELQRPAAVEAPAAPAAKGKKPRA